MGHKVNPRGIRLGITADWRAKWYAESKDYANMLYSDLQARAYLEKSLKPAGVSTILIERLPERVSELAHVIACVARPGVVIGKKGGLIDRIKQQLGRIMGGTVNLSIREIQKPELDAKLVAENISSQLVRRIMFRRAMKRAVSTAMSLGALGLKVNVAGRLGGAEIARNDCYQEGRMPLHTFRADIDYGVAEAMTAYGVIGIKVWVFKSEVFSKNRGLLRGISQEQNLRDRSSSGDKRKAPTRRNEERQKRRLAVSER